MRQFPCQQSDVVAGEAHGSNRFGLLLSLRAAATVACRLVMTPMIRLLGRTALLTVTCLIAALLCAAVALPLPVAALAVVLSVLGFCLGVGQPLSMTTVVQAAPDSARSTALALRLTGNRLGQVAAPAAAGLIAGVAGVGAPFLTLGVLLLGATGLSLRGGGRAGQQPPQPLRPGRKDHGERNGAWTTEVPEAARRDGS